MLRFYNLFWILKCSIFCRFNGIYSFAEYMFVLFLFHYNEIFDFLYKRRYLCRDLKFLKFVGKSKIIFCVRITSPKPFCRSLNLWNNLLPVVSYSGYIHSFYYCNLLWSLRAKFPIILPKPRVGVHGWKTSSELYCYSFIHYIGLTSGHLFLFYIWLSTQYWRFVK